MRNLVLAAATCGIMLSSASALAGESWISKYFTRLDISATLGIDGTNASARGIDGTNDKGGASTKGIDGTNSKGIDGTNSKGIDGTNGKGGK